MVAQETLKLARLFMDFKELTYRHPSPDADET
jgi:hypothetical protein